jgi:TRAP-type C4-dicarboxylate transport system permease small subunit
VRAEGAGTTPTGAPAGLDRLRRRIDRVGLAMNHVAGWMFVVCALFVTSDVMTRWLFGFSSRGTTEITGYMLAFGIAWGLADALTTRSHIRVDVLVTRMPLGVRAFMHVLALAALAVIAAVFAWRGWAVVLESWEFGARDTSALSIPLIVPQGLWAAGLAVFCVLTVVMLAEVSVLLVRGRRREIDRLLGPRTVQEETAEALEASGTGRGPG